MSLVLERTTSAAIPLEVDSVRIETLREQSFDAIRRTRIQFGNARVELGEHFAIRGSAADSELRWEGDCSRVKLIGAGMIEGRMHVSGDVGMHAGSEMRGGELVIDGNAGDFAGVQMRDGKLTIRGDAGDYLGGAFPGARRGMRGGMILVHGNAGDECGGAMRRGTIAVAGSLGASAGHGMLAGTILCGMSTGLGVGAEMRRGTIVLNEPPAAAILPSFRKSGRSGLPTFLRFYGKRLEEIGFPLAEGFAAAEYQRYCGDFLALGRGEMFLRIRG